MQHWHFFQEIALVGFHAAPALFSRNLHFFEFHAAPALFSRNLHIMIRAIITLALIVYKI
jgi:hypothetical protein